MLPYLAAANSDPPFPRLTIVSSDTHYWTDLNSEEMKSDKILEKLSDKDYCSTSYVESPTLKYCILLTVFFIRVMSRRYFVSKRKPFAVSLHIFPTLNNLKF